MSTTATPLTEFDAQARTLAVNLLLAEAVTRHEVVALTRLALRSEFMWRCHPCKVDHFLTVEQCACGADRPAFECCPPVKKPVPAPAATPAPAGERPALPRRVRTEYEVPALTRGEVSTRSATDARPADCPHCRRGTPVGHWPGPRCASSFRPDDNGTERLYRVHCTCDRCW